MKLKTEKKQIKNVARRWHRIYDHPGHAPDKHEIGRKLDLLDPEQASALDIKNIIGNSSWTDLTCDECGEVVKKIVKIGCAESNSPVELCKKCLAKALSLIL